MFGTIDEAVKVYGVSKATIERKISAGDLPSYRDSTGRKVWLKPFDSLKTTLEMLADEIANLKANPQTVRDTIDMNPQTVRDDPQTVRDMIVSVAVESPQRFSIKRAGQPDFDDILSLIKIRWLDSGGSLNDLDRELGFCQGWCSRIFKAKRDKRGELPKRSKRCWPNWFKIQSFLEDNIAAAA